MCTSRALPAPDGRHLFGRTRDLDTHFGEAVTITPRRFRFSFGGGSPQSIRYAILGMAAVADGYPLYAEAMNEAGLCMAGLRFAESAAYADPSVPTAGKRDLAPWELIPYLLGNCATVSEARQALSEIRVVAKPFSDTLPAAPLHWHMADADPTHGGLVVEVTAAGMRLYEAETGALANEPPYPAQLAALQAAEIGRAHGGLVVESEPTKKAHGRSLVEPDPTALPAGYGSPARFARASILRRWWLERGSTCAAVDGTTQTAGYAVAQFFSLLGAVSPTAGAVMTPEGGCHRTLYTCCMDTAAGVYYYKTETDAAVRSVGFGEGDLNGEGVIVLS